MPTPKQIMANRLNYLKYGNYSGHRIIIMFDETAQDPAELSNQHAAAYPSERNPHLRPHLKRIAAPRHASRLSPHLVAAGSADAHDRPQNSPQPKQSTRSLYPPPVARRNAPQNPLCAASASQRLRVEEPSLFGTKPRPRRNQECRTKFASPRNLPYQGFP